jgi:hypothetical protein
LAKCTLDLAHPYFQQLIQKLKSPDFDEGLAQARAKIEAEHTSCHRVVQQMPDHPDCQNKIWKYDWAPVSQRAERRKGWRLIAIVPEPTVQPYHLIAATVYAKRTTSKLSLKELSKIYAAITRPIPEGGISLDASAEERFHRVNTGEGGQIRSMCLICMDPVAISFEMEEVEIGEAAHICPGEPDWDSN